MFFTKIVQYSTVQYNTVPFYYGTVHCTVYTVSFLFQGALEVALSALLFLLYCTVYTVHFHGWMSEFEPVLPQSHFACAFVLLLKILHEIRKNIGKVSHL